MSGGTSHQFQEREFYEEDCCDRCRGGFACRVCGVQAGPLRDEQRLLEGLERRGPGEDRRGHREVPQGGRFRRGRGLGRRGGEDRADLARLLLRRAHLQLQPAREEGAEYKINRIKENISRLKINNLICETKDATISYKNDFNKYDVIICDVPCTGLGVINKKPDIKLNYSENRMITLIDIQRKIIESSCDYLKERGLLAYSTCTTKYEENEDNINYFLSRHINFRKIFEKRIDNKNKYKSDGFYFCILEKIND